jgi:hypothetical protein
MNRLAIHNLSAVARSHAAIAAAINLSQPEEPVLNPTITYSADYLAAFIAVRSGHGSRSG